MPGRERVPSFKLASGTTNERDGSYNISNTLGRIFYNTDTSNVEIRHEDPSNNVGWRDLVMNNRVGMDLSGVDNITFSDGTSQATAAPPFSHKQSEANTIYPVTAWGTTPGPNEVEITELSGLTITPTSSSQKVLLQVSVLGEWESWPHDGNISLKRIVGSTETWLDPRPVPNNRMPLNGMFTIGFHSDTNSTMESCQFIFVDTPNTTAQITYKIYLKVAGISDGHPSSVFHFNKNKNTGGTTDIYERGISTFTAECKG